MCLIDYEDMVMTTMQLQGMIQSCNLLQLGRYAQWSKPDKDKHRMMSLIYGIQTKWMRKHSKKRNAWHLAHPYLQPKEKDGKEKKSRSEERRQVKEWGGGTSVKQGIWESSIAINPKQSQQTQKMCVKVQALNSVMCLPRWKEGRIRKSASWEMMK